MLVEIRYENFRSFQKHTVFSMEAEGICEFKDSLLKWQRNKSDECHMVPLRIVYGQHASGKSTVFLGLQVLRQLLQKGNLCEGLPMSYQELVSGHDTTKPITLGICFIHEQKHFDFELCFHETAIISEVLRINRTLLYQRGEQGIEIAKNNRSLEYFSEQRISVLEINEQQFASFPKDCLFLTSAFVRMLAPASGQLFLDFMLHKITLIQDVQASFASAILQEQEAVSTFLHQLDMDYVIETPYEVSQGSCYLMGFIDAFITNMKQGGVLLVDDFNQVDPNIVMMLLSHLHDPSLNHKQAQVIFSTFSVQYLERRFLRRDEVSFISYEQGQSSLRTLLSYANRENNYLRKYLNGEYETIKQIDERYIYKEN